MREKKKVLYEKDLENSVEYERFSKIPRKKKDLQEDKKGKDHGRRSS
jgi:hypothetical protein